MSAAAVVGFSFLLDEEEEEEVAADDAEDDAAELDTRFTSTFRFLEELLELLEEEVAADAAAAAAAFRFLRARLWKRKYSSHGIIIMNNALSVRLSKQNQLP